MEAYKEKGGNGTKKKRWKLKLNHLPPWSIHCWPGGLARASLRKCWDNVCNFKHFQAWLILCCGFKAPNSCKSRAWGTRSVSHVSARTSQPAVTSLLPRSLSSCPFSSPAAHLEHTQQPWLLQTLQTYGRDSEWSFRFQNGWVRGTRVVIISGFVACLIEMPVWLLSQSIYCSPKASTPLLIPYLF